MRRKRRNRARRIRRNCSTQTGFPDSFPLQCAFRTDAELPHGFPRAVPDGPPHSARKDSDHPPSSPVCGGASAPSFRIFRRDAAGAAQNERRREHSPEVSELLRDVPNPPVHSEGVPADPDRDSFSTFPAEREAFRRNGHPQAEQPVQTGPRSDRTTAEAQQSKAQARNGGAEDGEAESGAASESQNRIRKTGADAETFRALSEPEQTQNGD